jgi:trimethylamine--corrinoid protein Co-methyltransferase
MSQKGLEGGSYKPLSQESIDRIHQASLRVFEEVGFEVNSETALGLFSQAGAWVDRERRIVRMPSRMVMDLLSTAPSQVRLCGQDEEHDVLLGGTKVHAGTGGTALNIIDSDTGLSRRATLDDLKRITRLVDRLENIHLFMLPVYPSDVPHEHVDVNRFFSGLDNTTKHVMGGVYTLDGIRQAIRMAEIIRGSPQELRRRPLISMITCSISPLKIDGLYGDMLVQIAEAGLPVVCPAEPLCGATSPVTLAGTLVIQNVDSLAGVLLTQVVNPGTPVIYGSVASNTDLRDLKYITGSVEMGLLNAAGAQMAQFYHLPFYATAGMSDAKVVDAQCGYESALTSLLCALAGANFIHDAAGMMEFALSVSYEKYVVDNEILGMVMRAVEGVKVDDDTIAFDVIKQVGPGGHFISTPHTRKHMRSEHYYPSLSDRLTREQWELEGRKDACIRAKEMVSQLLSEHEFRLPSSVRDKVLSEIPGILD